MRGRERKRAKERGRESRTYDDIFLALRDLVAVLVGRRLDSLTLVGGVVRVLGRVVRR